MDILQILWESDNSERKCLVSGSLETHDNASGQIVLEPAGFGWTIKIETSNSLLPAQDEILLHRF